MVDVTVEARDVGGWPLFDRHGAKRHPGAALDPSAVTMALTPNRAIWRLQNASFRNRAQTPRSGFGLIAHSKLRLGTAVLAERGHGAQRRPASTLDAAKFAHNKEGPAAWRPAWLHPKPSEM
jgi:hypothetical protein